MEHAIKLGCMLELVPELKVSAANGKELRCKKMCKGFTWVVKGQSFKVDVLALPLGNYDLVFGVQWLVELDDILWNFKKLQIKFKWGGQEYVLQRYKGLQNSALTISNDRMDKVLRK